MAAILQMLQSTSPSYILMASLDLARMQMATEGGKLLGKAIELAEEARARINRIAGLRCLGAARSRPGADSAWTSPSSPSRSRGSGLTGYAASTILNTEFGIQVEMADLYNVLVIVSIGDRRDDLDRLVGGLEGLARRGAGRGARIADISAVPPVQETALACSPREAYFGPARLRPVVPGGGRVSADIVTIYPPGIPILVPGEIVSRTAVEYLQIPGRARRPHRRCPGSPGAIRATAACTQASRSRTSGCWPADGTSTARAHVGSGPRETSRRPAREMFRPPVLCGNGLHFLPTLI